MTGYLVFNELDVKLKTKVFEVRNKGDEFLGTIHWKPGWRRYTFLNSAEPADFDEACLKEILEFIHILMEERK